MEPGQTPPQKKAKLAEPGQPTDELGRQIDPEMAARDVVDKGEGDQAPRRRKIELGRPSDAEIEARDEIQLLAAQYAYQREGYEAATVVDGAELDDAVSRILSQTGAYEAIVVNQQPLFLDAIFAFVGGYLVQEIGGRLEDHGRVAVFRKLPDDAARRLVREAITMGGGFNGGGLSIIMGHYPIDRPKRSLPDDDLIKLAMSSHKVVGDSSRADASTLTGAEIEEAVTGVMGEKGYDPMPYHIRVVHKNARQPVEVTSLDSIDELKKAIYAHVDVEHE